VHHAAILKGIYLTSRIHPYFLAGDTGKKLPTIKEGLQFVSQVFLWDVEADLHIVLISPYSEREAA